MIVRLAYGLAALAGIGAAALGLHGMVGGAFTLRIGWLVRVRASPGRGRHPCAYGMAGTRGLPGGQPSTSADDSVGRRGGSIT